MTKQEMLSHLEYVSVRLLDLQDWDSSKRIESIKKFIKEYPDYPFEMPSRYEEYAFGADEARMRA